MDDEIKKKFEQLEAKFAALETHIKKTEDDIGYYIDNHGDLHHELSAMIYPSYFKTHPEFCKDLNRFDDIVAGKTKGTDKPKS